MANPNAVVSIPVRLDPPLDRPPADLLQAEGGLAVVLDGEIRARLDPADPRSAGFTQILDGMRAQRSPVYLELDPETSTITRLLIPYVTRIDRVYPILVDVLGVELELSHARHLLRRSAPDFDEMEGQLREAQRTEAPVVVTEDDAHDIIDVRSLPPGVEWPAYPFHRPGRPELPPWQRWMHSIVLWIWCWCWPWWWWRGISMTRAQQVFDSMNATSCDPLTVPPPCIPFLYPDDGCWARAHEMCRLIINMNLSPRKVWIQGSLHVATRNNPSCQVWWGWHVAPTLCVRGPGFFQVRTMVIDPSLFTTPVSEATWKGVQGDPNATLTDSAASDYLWGMTDPNYVDTNQKLAFYRLQLQNRAIQQGPPPYAICP
jgi:Glutaminase